MKSRFPKVLSLFVAFDVIVLSVVALFFWSSQETRPLAWDQAIHTKIAWIYNERLSGESQSKLFAPVDMNYPPIFHLSLMAALKKVTDPAHAGAAVNVFWMAILVLCVWGIGSKLMGPWEGAAAAAIVMCYPIVIDMMRDTMIDFSLMGWVALAMLTLVMSESFSRPVWSVLFAFSLAGGMLTKWTALAYVMGPLVYVAWLAFRQKHTRWMWVSFGVLAILLAPWYIPNLLPILSRIPRLSKLPPAGGQRLHGLANVLWYPISLFEQMTLVFVALLAIGVVFSVRRKELYPVLAWFVVSLVLFSLIRNRNTRYFMPALPAAALLSVAWFRSAPRWIKPLLVTGALLMSLGTQFALGKQIGFKSGPEWIDVYNPRHGISENWQHKTIIDYMSAQTPAFPGRPIRVLVLSNSAYFHSSTLNMSARKLGGKPITFYGPSKRRSFEFADFVLVKTGDVGPEFTLGTINACLNVAKDPNSWFPHVYKEVQRWTLGDQSEAILYATKPDPENISDVGIFNLNLQQFEMPNIVAERVRMKATPLSAADTRVGRLKEFTIECGVVRYKKIPFENVTIRLKQPQINLPVYFKTQSLELLSLETLEVHATFHSEALLTMAADKVQWLKDPQLEFDGDRISITGRAQGVPLSISARVDATDSVLQTHIEHVSVAHIPVPLILLRAFTDQTVVLNANEDLAYNLRIAPITGQNDALRLGQ